MRIVREAERRQKTGISRVQWWRLEQEDRAPKRIRLGPNSIGWLEEELDAFIADRAASRGLTSTAKTITIGKASSVTPRTVARKGARREVA